LITHVSEIEALTFVKKQKHKAKWHNDFNEWKKHLILLVKTWPQLKKFYQGNGKWLGYFDDGELVGVYWYNIQGDEIYDGFLISSKVGVGIKLGRYLENEITWKTNWSCCSFKYINFNKRLGFIVYDKIEIEGEELFLLWRQERF
jgi:hypothetical protein